MNHQSVSPTSTLKYLLLIVIICISAGLVIPTTQAHAGSGPTGYTFCANENVTCSFSGTANIAFGANGVFNYKTATSSIACNTATFGDPTPNVAKACYFGPAGYSFCANEFGTCSFTGTANIAFGANGMFNYKTATNSITCNTTTFGDPAQNVVKACYFGPAAYTFCANEFGTCSFSGTARVAFGANGAFNYQMATNSIACTTTTFGDPIFGTAKACYYQISSGGPSGYTFCANENVTCSFSGTASVAYGANGTFNYQTATTSLACTNAIFGDPTPGVAKACYYQITGIPNPTNTPTSGFVVSESQFLSWFPSRNNLYTYANFLTAQSAYPSFANSGNTTQDKQEAAAFFAHVAHETSYLVYVDEQNYTPGYYQSCGTYQCIAGQDYHGRGPLQISWNYNYSMASDGMYYANPGGWVSRMTPTVGADILHNANLVSTDGVITWKTALWYWVNHGKDWDPAKATPHDHIVAGGAGFGATINDINGGIECNQPSGTLGYNEMMDRANIYTNFLSNLGVSDSRTKTC